MKFYALVLWRARGQIPRLLQLMYLGDGQVVRYAPDEADLLATERKVQALWRAIERATDAGDWRPRPGRLCEWCAHKALCPEFGGTPPPLPGHETLPGRGDGAEALASVMGPADVNTGGSGRDAGRWRGAGERLSSGSRVVSARCLPPP